jgi:hypothetical protein
MFWRNASVLAPAGISPFRVSSNAALFIAGIVASLSECGGVAPHFEPMSAMLTLQPILS